MKIRTPTFACATTSVAVATIAVWVRWTYFTPPSYYLPRNIALVLPCLFIAGLVAGLGSAIPRRKALRVSLQVIAGAMLLALVALPTNPDWFLHVPKAKTWLPGPVPGKAREESLVTVATIPSFKSEKDYQVMALSFAPPIEILCGESYSPWLKTIPKDRELTFTVWRTKRVTGHFDDGEENFTWDDRLETIRDKGAMLYDARLCPLHHVMMERVEVPVFYGLPSEEFMKASEDFSGGPGFVSGGCVRMEGISPKTEMAYRCRTCADLYAKWEAEERNRIDHLQQK